MIIVDTYSGWKENQVQYKEDKTLTEEDKLRRLAYIRKYKPGVARLADSVQVFSGTKSNAKALLTGPVFKDTLARINKRRHTKRRGR